MRPQDWTSLSFCALFLSYLSEAGSEPQGGRQRAGGPDAQSLPELGPRPAGTESLVCSSSGDSPEVGDGVSSRFPWSPAPPPPSGAAQPRGLIHECVEHTQLSVC